MKIPFNKIHLTNKELEYINDALTRGQISGDGHYTRLVENHIKESFNTKRVFMTTSATHALEMAVMMIDIKPGDEIIMPSYTFPSCANAVLLRGAKIVFSEIKEDTLNIDPDDVKRKITFKTRAIMPVHYAGISCEMDKLLDIAAYHNLYVIEDAAHAVNALYKGKYLGTLGHMGCYSFHGTKNYICGEGGALLLNTDASDLYNHASIIRQKGTNREQFLTGKIDKYSWVGLGSSYTPSDMLMAFLYAQLICMNDIKNKRKIIHDYYTVRLSKYVEKKIIRTNTIPQDCESNYHIFYVLFNDENIRSFAEKQLKKKGIQASNHFVPLHSSPMGLSLGYKTGQLPITEMAGKCLLRLPIYTDMTLNEREYVIDNLEEILKVI
ncbi:dTDP-4-amino-4,6-dideoxygalactose transaminase [Oxobacter pfennigii]|uniref:dTDP-4-amino-4,6-dideoxygalactose transaminase n=1 Tax=Oxobacter pfennigii TaxID=36849 RepID=A0A0P8W9J6_9CLOT|nr:dTDP-4-amino-4,6-dideoxygalactose transaminase [Oxobacter pfennigii]KPU45314.1 dTDP-4-amino-4,6-dideoxygalactose transaminase [Oxobacter pfennigii]